MADFILPPLTINFIPSRCLCSNAAQGEKMRKLFFCTLPLVLSGSLVVAQPAPSTALAAAPPVALPAPARSGGMALNDALAHRRSVRSFQPVRLTLQEVSQLLWAAQGVTDDKGHRTAPSAHAQYFLHLYLAQPEGFYEYLPTAHALRKLSDKDLRAALSSQPTVQAAPAVFLIAGEYDRATKLADRETALRLVNLEAGHTAQNLLLEATALDLGAVPVGGIDANQTARAASLPATITPIYLVPVGHPK
jgi:SagB-type dehydrogenase family enzyme